MKMSQEVIDIDGGVMEGGGQILRMAMAFSTLLKKPIRVYNIRAGRSSPGLRPQHLAGVRLVQDICHGKLNGGSIGSTEITFYPGDINFGKYSADPGTAGSIMLLFQISMPCLLFADGPVDLYLKGGTNAEMAPQIDHTLMVFKPIAEKLNAKFDCDIIRRGYYPKGGGEVMFKITPVNGYLKPVEMLDQGAVVEIFGRSFVAGVLPIKMAHVMADASQSLLQQHFPGVPLKIERVKELAHTAFGNGSGIVLVARTSTGCLLGGSALGKRDVSSEQVGESAANQLIEDVNSGGCVDRFVQDQLVIFMALAKGKSRIQCGKITLHSETAIHVAEKLTQVKFNVQKNDTQTSCIIECEGIGMKR